jgi:hypothetical protein
MPGAMRSRPLSSIASVRLPVASRTGAMLTDAQRERIAANRAEALRRRALLAAGGDGACVCAERVRACLRACLSLSLSLI